MSTSTGRSGTLAQFFNLAEDHGKLALLEASYERQNFIRAFICVVLAACTFLGAILLLQAALVSGLMALGLAVWQAALGLAVIEGGLSAAFFIAFRSNAWRPDTFQGSREEFKRTFAWIEQHLN